MVGVVAAVVVIVVSAAVKPLDEVRRSARPRRTHSRRAQPFSQVGRFLMDVATRADTTGDSEHRSGGAKLEDCFARMPRLEAALLLTGLRYWQQAQQAGGSSPSTPV